MEPPRRLPVALTVNGEAHEREVEPRLLLSDFLRHDLELPGTHVGCEHGVCGACTVLLDGEAVRSCLLFAVQADGREVVTVEGLAETAWPPCSGGGRPDARQRRGPPRPDGRPPRGPVPRGVPAPPRGVGTVLLASGRMS